MINTQIAIFNAIDWTAWKRKKGIFFFSSIKRTMIDMMGIGYPNAAQSLSSLLT
jgi:hypothetical protein